MGWRDDHEIRKEVATARCLEALDNHKRRIPMRCTCEPCAYWFSLLGHTLPEHCVNPGPEPPEPEKP